MAKKNTISWAAMQGIVGFWLLLLCLFNSFFPNKLMYAVVTTGLCVLFTLLLGRGLRKLAYTKQEQENQHRAQMNELQDERNIRLREIAGNLTQKIVFFGLCILTGLVCFVVPVPSVVIGLCVGLLGFCSFGPLVFTLFFARRM